MGRGLDRAASHRGRGTCELDVLSMITKKTPKKGERFTPEDGMVIHANPAKFFTPKKALDIESYSGEPHSFAFYSSAARTPRPAVAAQVFEEIDAWLRRQLRTPPMPIDPRFVKQVPFYCQSLVAYPSRRWVSHELGFDR